MMKLFFRIEKDIDLTFDYLTDMQKLVSVHPVITQIVRTGDETHKVYETLQLGLVPFSFTYRVRVESNPRDKTLVISATVFKLTKIVMKFFLTRDGEGTLVEEHIDFKTPLPILWILKNTFRKQHRKLFQNIEAL